MPRDDILKTIGQIALLLECHFPCNPDKSHP